MVKDPKIAKAIQVTELQNDLANLMKQAQAVAGAMQYIQSKIDELSKPEKEE